ncbi:MAG: hypothetical protein KKB31_03970 [Nanoarchaeota archaeon]|nr:hypothetical protein [Nanoarchaeota archaeon]
MRKSQLVEALRGSVETMSDGKPYIHSRDERIGEYQKRGWIDERKIVEIKELGDASFYFPLSKKGCQLIEKLERNSKAQASPQ